MGKPADNNAMTANTSAPRAPCRDPALMSERERLREIAAILARTWARLHEKRQPEKEGSNPLDVCTPDAPSCANASAVDSLQNRQHRKEAR